MSKKQITTLILALSSLISIFAIAAVDSNKGAGPKEYKSVLELKNAGFYRLTCSDTKNSSEVHLYLEVNNGQTTDLKLISIFPGLSLQAFTLNPLNATKIQHLDKKITLSGNYTGAYYDQKLNMDLSENNNGFSGSLSFDDGDGAFFDRMVTCKAVNYILSPSK